MADREPTTAAASSHVHRWVDKSLLWEPPLKVCECGATMTDTEYRNGLSAAANTECSFVKRGDFNDCAHAGGGRGAKDEWCDSCKAVYGPSAAASPDSSPFEEPSYETVEKGIGWIARRAAATSPGSLYDNAFPRIEEIRQENVLGDVNAKDIAWLCEVAEASARLCVYLSRVEPVQFKRVEGCNRWNRLEGLLRV